MGKKLTTSAINTAFNKHFTRRKLIVNVNNNDYEVYVDEHVQQSKLEDLFSELFQKYEYSQKNDLGLDSSYYAQVLLLKYFTDIPMGDDLGTQLQIFIKLKDLNILDSIMDVLDETELNELMPKVMKNLTSKVMSGEMNKYMIEHPEEAIKMLGLGDLFKMNKNETENGEPNTDNEAVGDINEPN
jgi:hypothetical protein